MLLSTGSAVPPNRNTSEAYTGVFDPGPAQPVDAELQAVATTAFEGAGEVRDTTSVAFSLAISDPTVRGLRIDVVFASDEYPEFADSAFVDVAAVVVNGANYALFNQQSSQPLSVTGRNLGAGNFRANADGSIPLEYDGVSRLLSVVVPVDQGINTLKFGVADTGDEAYDSALFVARLQPVDFAGFGLAPIVQVGGGAPGTGSGGATVDLPGNQIYTFLQGFQGLINFGAAAPGSSSSGGNDVVDGSNAFVTVAFDWGLASLLGVEVLPDGLKLQTVDGTKVLNDVERILTSDAMFAFDTDRGEPAWNALAMLRAMLGTSPDVATLSTWVKQADAAGNQPALLAGQMLEAFLPGVDAPGLITHLCQVLLGVSPAPAVLDMLAGLIGPGRDFPTEADFFSAVAASDALNSMVAFTGAPLVLDPVIFAAA